MRTCKKLAVVVRRLCHARLARDVSIRVLRELSEGSKRLVEARHVWSKINASSIYRYYTHHYFQTSSPIPCDNLKAASLQFSRD